MYSLYRYSLTEYNKPDTFVDPGAEMVNKTENSNFQGVYIVVGGAVKQTNKIYSLFNYFKSNRGTKSREGGRRECCY